MTAWLLIIAAILGGLFILLGSGGSQLDNLPGAATAVAVLLVLLALYAAATRSTQPEASAARRWSVRLLAVAVLAVAAWFGYGQMDTAALLTHLNTGIEGSASRTTREPAASDAFRSVRIRKNAKGQFMARGEINGNPADMLIDTGASAIVLRHADAEKAGVDMTALTYSVPVETAAGATHAAAVRLRTLTVGSIEMDGIEALVAQPGSLNESLLGMSFLRRLRSYEISGDFITLRE